MVLLVAFQYFEYALVYALKLTHDSYASKNETFKQLFFSVLAMISEAKNLTVDYEIRAQNCKGNLIMTMV